jgi:hypothetical protein
VPDRASTAEINKYIDKTSRSRSPTIVENRALESESERSNRPQERSINTTSVDSESHQDRSLRRTLVETIEADSPISKTIRRDNPSTIVDPHCHSPIVSSLDARPASAPETPTPATIADVPESDRSRSQIPDPPKQSLQGKPKVEVDYHVILSRSPVYESNIWLPEGSFQEKTLLQLIYQLPFHGDIKGLDFTLEGPGVKTKKQRIDSGDESGFEKLKRHAYKQMLRP